VKESLRIDGQEFVARQKNAVAAAKEKGFDGLLVWSREGPPMEYYGDVLYLTNHHCAMNHIEDTTAWTARGFNALVLPVDEEPVLITDLPVPADVPVHVDDVRVTLHVPQTTADVLREKNLAERRIGLVGRAALLASHHRVLTESLGAPISLEPADEIVAKLRMMKSKDEIALLRHAADVGGACVSHMMEAIVEGVTDAEIVGEGFRKFIADGGRPFDIAIASGPEAHHYWAPNGPPHWNATRRLESGDFIHVDLWGPVEGYYMDFARNTVVGGRPTGRQREALEGTVELVDYIVDGIKPGAMVGDLYALGEKWLHENDFAPEGEDFHALIPLFGHGMGVGLERPWITAGEPTRLEPNMVIAIEGMVAPEPGIGAFFEHEVLVTEDGHEVLDSACPDRWWD
jgi:Xaa-Pro aminopeptidase